MLSMALRRRRRAAAEGSAATELSWHSRRQQQPAGAIVVEASIIGFVRTVLMTQNKDSKGSVVKCSFQTKEV
jgi:hypothetical protein